MTGVQTCALPISGGEASARQARDGAPLFALGQALCADGQAERGLRLMTEALAKGVQKHPDDARLRLGAALQATGQRDAALAQWQGITSNDGAADLARLWRLLR